MNRECLEADLQKVLYDNGIQPMPDRKAPIPMDSVEFVSVIVDIEKAFSISIPDELLPVHQSVSFDGFVYMIEESVKWTKP